MRKRTNTIGPRNVPCVWRVLAPTTVTRRFRNACPPPPPYGCIFPRTVWSRLSVYFCFPIIIDHEFSVLFLQHTRIVDDIVLRRGTWYFHVFFVFFAFRVARPIRVCARPPRRDLPPPDVSARHVNTTDTRQYGSTRSIYIVGTPKVGAAAPLASVFNFKRESY